MLALLLAALRYAVSEDKIKELGRVDTTYETAEDLRAHLSLVAWISAIPLLLLATVPALASVQVSFVTPCIVGLFVLTWLSIPLITNYLTTQFPRFGRELNSNALAFLAGLKNISGKGVIFFICVLPEVLLHESTVPDFMGRYSKGYFLFLVAYVSYAVFFLALFLFSNLSEKNIIGIKNQLSNLLLSIDLTAGAVRGLVILLVLVGSVGCLLSGAWRFLNVIDDRGIANVGHAYGLAAIGALTIVAAVTKLITGSFFYVGRLRLSSVLLAGALMFLIHWVTVHYMIRLGPQHIELWKSITPTVLPKMLSWSCVAIAIFFTLNLILWPESKGQFKVLTNSLRNFGVLTMCGVCAYAIVFVFAPGYFVSAYLYRWAFVPSFLLIFAFAIAGYTYLMMACALISGEEEIGSKPSPVATNISHRSV